MPIGGKDAFLSKVTFRRESKWYSKTKQELKDMETIEERAEEYIARRWGESIDEIFKMQLMEAFIVGAGTQKAIDEEVRLKKCDDMTEAEYDREVAFADWYHKNGKGTPTFSDAIEWARKEVISKVCEWLKARNVLTEVSIEGFKKAMEESVWK